MAPPRRRSSDDHDNRIPRRDPRTGRRAGPGASAAARASAARAGGLELRPRARLRHAPQRVRRLRADAGRPRARRRRPGRRAARRPEHPSARGGDSPGAAAAERPGRGVARDVRTRRPGRARRVPGRNLAEDAFLKDARPWPRYTADYRALVETARQQHWRVIAANVPRRLASDVSKSGKGVLDSLQAADKPFVARDLKCPTDDDYYRRFAEQMGGHPAPGSGEPGQKDAADAQARVERFYWAQCLKDETMAESIVSAFEKQAGPGTLVHFNGSFHSDFGEGTAERVRRRLPGRRVAVISILPVESVDALAPAGED